MRLIGIDECCSILSMAEFWRFGKGVVMAEAA